MDGKYDTTAINRVKPPYAVPPNSKPNWKTAFPEPESTLKQKTKVISAKKVRNFL